MAQGPIGGCLARAVQGWEAIGAEQWVLQVLREGYQIPFHSVPPLSRVPLHRPTYPASSERGLALTEEVLALLEKDAVEPAPSTPGFYSRLFVVPKVSGGFRPVIDLSRLNGYVATSHFRMQTPQSILESVRQDDWMVTVDLKDAYLQVPVHPRCRQFLRFCWGGHSLQFTTLCFGLSTAPQVFTRMMAPVAAAMHRQGIRLLLYLDDWLLLAPSRHEAVDAVHRLLELCTCLGLRVNHDKSHLVPTQTIVYLGMTIQSVHLKAFPSQERVTRFLQVLHTFLASPQPPASLWMSLLGHMASLIHLVPGSRLRMRSLQLHLRQQWNRSQDDSTPVAWPASALPDLQWWGLEKHLLRGKDLLPTFPDFLLFTDASTQGWGCSLLHHTAGGRWSLEESRLHINVLELRAVGKSLLHFLPLLRGHTVGVYADNTTALAYLKHQGGTRSEPLNSEAQRILRWTEAHQISLTTRFLSGLRNVVADAVSRRGQVLPTEWTLHPEVCKALWRLWGQPSVDLFATSLNFRLQAFVSPFPDPMAIASDAFLFNWNHLELYAFPPPAVIRRVINKLLTAQGTYLTLIAPFWPRQEWFPDLLRLSVDTPRLLPQRPDLLRQPHFHRFHHDLRSLQLTAWRLSNVSSSIAAIPEVWRRSWRALTAPPLL